MFNGYNNRDSSVLPVILFSDDADLMQTAHSALNGNSAIRFSVIENSRSSSLPPRELHDAALVIADLGSPDQKEEGLSYLRNLKGQVRSGLPIIVAVDSFNEVVARLLVQIGVADILVKPVAPAELLQACARVLRTDSEESQIYTFLPVAGGVGNTTLAIQAALTLLRHKDRKNKSTCLVDLNFRRGACADYLDIEPRLNLKEIQQNPSRLDRQLLESMLSQHPSGLAVIAAPNLPTEPASETPNVVMGLLNIACQCFDQIVIDMPNAWHSWSDKILLGSNKLFLVCEATVPSLKKSNQLVQTIRTTLGGGGPQPAVIVNRFEWQLFSPSLRRADIEKSLGDAFGGTIPYNRRLLREALDRGIPINEVRKNSNIAAAVKRLITPSPKLNVSSRPFSRPPTLNWA